MIKIAAVHPDIIWPERVRLGAPRLNAEWLELFNAGSTPVNIHRFFVANKRGDGFTLSLPRTNKLLVGAYQSLLVFSGRPDNPEDPALCYLATQSNRVFLKRQGYFWDPVEDTAYLYTSRDDFLTDPKSFVDLYHYKRRSAKIVIPT